MHVLGTPPAFVLSQDQTLHHNPVQGFCSQVRSKNSLESLSSIVNVRRIKLTLDPAWSSRFYRSESLSRGIPVDHALLVYQGWVPTVNTRPYSRHTTCHFRALRSLSIAHRARQYTSRRPLHCSHGRSCNVEVPCRILSPVAVRHPAHQVYNAPNTPTRKPNGQICYPGRPPSRR